MKESYKSLFSASILHEKLLIVQKNLLFSDSSIGALDSSQIELDTSQKTLSACSQVGDSQEISLHGRCGNTDKVESV